MWRWVFVCKTYPPKTNLHFLQLSTHMGQIQARREVESGAKIGEVHDPNKKCQLEAFDV